MFRTIFTADYDTLGITIKVGTTTIDNITIAEVRTCDPDNGLIKAVVTPQEMIDTIAESLDDEWWGECVCSFYTENDEQWYYTAIFNSVVC